MKKLPTTVFAIGCVFLSLMPYSAVAQTTQLVPFYIHLNPSYPQPHSSVSLSLSSNSISVINSTFTVTVNGTNVGTGTGRQPILFKTGDPGKSMLVIVKVTSGGKTYTQTVTLHPASVALIVEPVATAPAWYLGTPTIPPFGNVRLVAIPNMQVNNKQISSSALSYTWKIGNETLKASGVGKNSVIIDSPLPYRENTVSVLVQNLQNTQTAQQAITLISGAPVVYIYKSNPLTGINYGHALSSVTSIGSVESTFAAVPYGFSLTGGLPTITWFLNGDDVQTGPSLTVRPKGAGTGSATLSTLVNTASTNESGSAQIPLSFGTNTGGFGLFGL